MNNTLNSRLSKGFAITAICAAMMIAFTGCGSKDGGDSETAVSSGSQSTAAGGGRTATEVDAPVEDSRAYDRNTPWPIPGRIEAEYYDDGGEGVAYHDTTPGNDGDTDTRNDDVDISNGLPKGVKASQGEWLEYSVNATKAGRYLLLFDVANGSDKEAFVRVHVDGEAMTAHVPVPPTGGWNKKQKVETPVFFRRGPHVVRVTFSGSQILDSIQFKLDTAN